MPWCLYPWVPLLLKSGKDSSIVLGCLGLKSFNSSEAGKIPREATSFIVSGDLPESHTFLARTKICWQYKDLIGCASLQYCPLNSEFIPILLPTYVILLYQDQAKVGSKSGEEGRAECHC